MDDVILGQSSGGKDIVLSSNKSTAGFRLALSGGGNQPLEFEGIFTRFSDADRIARAYMARNPQVEKVITPVKDEKLAVQLAARKAERLKEKE